LSPLHAAHLAVLILAVASAILVYLLARESLRELLSRTVKVRGGVVFYTRAFLLMLVFGVVGQAVTASPDLKGGQRFMEYVWAVAASLGDSFDYVFLTLAIYLVLVTILVATLKPKDDE
jgi:NADH:ubiquinone oxidoreductase subunit 6 (subunit J)